MIFLWCNLKFCFISWKAGSWVFIEKIFYYITANIFLPLSLNLNRYFWHQMFNSTPTSVNTILWSLIFVFYVSRRIGRHAFWVSKRGWWRRQSGLNLCRFLILYKTSFHPTTAGLHQVWRRNEIWSLIYILRGSMYMLRQGCSLSMLHRTCEKLHGGGGLA